MLLSSIPHKKRSKAINYESEERAFRPSRKAVPLYMSKTTAFVNRPTGRRHLQPEPENLQVPVFRPQRRQAPEIFSAPPSQRPSRRLFPERKESDISLVWNCTEISPRVRPLDAEKFSALCASTALSFAAGRSARQALVVRERGTPDLLSWR